MLNRFPVYAAASILFFHAATAQAEFERPYLLIAGSSTIFPLASAVADHVSASGKVRKPKVESTGTGGGIKLFCEGTGRNYPDIVLASRIMKKTERDECSLNGVSEITELKIGYDGIVVAQSRKDKPLSLTNRDLYLALAKTVPDPKCGSSCDRLVPNPYKKWSEVNSALPDAPIMVWGPPLSSGTRDTFAEDVLEAGCASFPAMKQMMLASEAKFKKLCQTIREDGVYENEPESGIIDHVGGGQGLGIVDFGVLAKHKSELAAVSIEGIEPTYESVKSQRYPVGRPLYMYVKQAHLGLAPGMEAYLKEFTSDKAWGDEGYLIADGLIPMPSAERTIEREKLNGVVALAEPAAPKSGKKSASKGGKPAAKGKSAKTKESKKSKKTQG
ncbi:substrate-binding domain-containing protein [Methylococcus geothermalis]|uniref:Phosphate-binding protein n=1 Tax=Methylococcus geothermalis TaxID=2681310 RepID=A0A858Q509_9GAMM|nr:substrate-binding domain-containing protein [Methylococcus geothermalis]QJD28911.1 phosphate-binding protein [Methylococcus geothermalis]